MWDPQLADVAQKYSEQCIFGHNNQRVKQQSTYSFVGESIYVSTASPSNPEDAVTSWYNEVHNYNYDQNSCHGSCGHYTQVHITHITELLLLCASACMHNVCTEYYYFIDYTGLLYRLCGPQQMLLAVEQTGVPLCMVFHQRFIMSILLFVIMVLGKLTRFK